MNRIFISAVFAAGFTVSIAVQADDCKYSKEIDTGLDLSGSDTLAVVARAGRLIIKGESGRDHVRIEGRVCVSKEAWLDESDVRTEGGKNARIEVELPTDGEGWSLFGGRFKNYARLDLELTVPDHVSLEVKDSSGSMEITGTGALSIEDSSGSIEVEDIGGPVSLKDSSGSITLTDINGDVTVISDSSGSIRGSDIEGTVLVRRDSSGSIRFSDVRDDFIVEVDSSGDIIAERVGGDFRVFKDGSGGIHSKDVAGEVSVPHG